MLGRVVVLCIAAGAVLAGLFGVVIWFTANHAPATAATKLVRGYYADLRDGRYSQAYARLCEPGGTEQAFVADQRQRAQTGKGVTSYDIHAGFTKDTSHLGSAGGVVTLADGSTQTVRFDLETLQMLDPSFSGDAEQCLLES
jgi:hypothetical protein